VTLICLSNIAYNNEKISEKDVENAILIGRYAEINATILRDYSKSDFKNEDLSNSFKMFSMIKENRGLKADRIAYLFKNQNNRELNEIKSILKEEVKKGIDKFFISYYLQRKNVEDQANTILKVNKPKF
jgi:uncharacterized protein YqfB (UPF0267 family)